MKLTQLLLAASLLCQAKDWALVKQIPAQQLVEVVVPKDRISGRLQSVTDDAIVIETNQQSKSIPKAEIRRVAIRSASGRGKNAAIGAAIPGYTTIYRVK